MTSRKGIYTYMHCTCVVLLWFNISFCISSRNATLRWLHHFIIPNRNTQRQILHGGVISDRDWGARGPRDSSGTSRGHSCVTFSVILHIRHVRISVAGTVFKQADPRKYFIRYIQRSEYCNNTITLYFTYWSSIVYLHCLYLYIL